LSATEAGRMRDKLTQINTSIASNVGADVWQETQGELTKIRGKK